MNSQNERSDGMTHAALVTRCASLETENARLRAALEDIRQNQGRVCAEYEVCRHVGCSSSHAAWEVADRALRAEWETEEA